MESTQATLGQIALSTSYQDVYASGNARAEGTLHLTNTSTSDRRVTVTLEAAGSSTNGVAETIFEGMVTGSTAGGDNTAQIRFISMDPTMDLRATQDSGTDVSSAFLGQEFA